VAKLVLERMDAMISETKDDGTYAAYSKVAGVVVTGNEDGAHHVISEVAGALIGIGHPADRPGQPGGSGVGDSGATSWSGTSRGSWSSSSPDGG
jgi:hypothetical protein